MVYVRKRQKENTEALLRRFSRKVQASGILNQTRKDRYYEKPANRRQRRARTLRGSEIKAEIEFLKKIGRIKEEYGPHAGRKKRRR